MIVDSLPVVDSSFSGVSVTRDWLQKSEKPRDFTHERIVQCTGGEGGGSEDTGVPFLVLVHASVRRAYRNATRNQEKV